MSTGHRAIAAVLLLLGVGFLTATFVLQEAFPTTDSAPRYIVITLGVIFTLSGLGMIFWIRHANAMRQSDDQPRERE